MGKTSWCCNKQKLLSRTLVVMYQCLLDCWVYQTLWQIPEVPFEQAGHRTRIRFREKVHMLSTLQPLFQGLHSTHVPIHSEQTLLMQGWGKIRETFYHVFHAGLQNNFTISLWLIPFCPAIGFRIVMLVQAIWTTNKTTSWQISH